ARARLPYDDLEAKTKPQFRGDPIVSTLRHHGGSELIRLLYVRGGGPLLCRARLARRGTGLLPVCFATEPGSYRKTGVHYQSSDVFPVLSIPGRFASILRILSEDY